MSGSPPILSFLFFSVFDLPSLFPLDRLHSYSPYLRLPSFSQPIPQLQRCALSLLFVLRPHPRSQHAFTQSPIHPPQPPNKHIQHQPTNQPHCSQNGIRSQHHNQQHNGPHRPAALHRTATPQPQTVPL